MKVNELKDKGQVDEITLKITAKEEPKDVRGGTLKMCNCTGEDDTGSITVTLWQADVEKVNVGDTIKITKGWVQDYQGKLQLSSGRFGTLEVVEAKAE
jgi:ssDNA-binding replication factor A large subunit